MRIVLPRNSQCCGKPMYIGRYSSGGFVKASCEGCGTQTTVSSDDFEKACEQLEISCKLCGDTMEATTDANGYGSYGFLCACGERLPVADIVPQLAR